MKRGIKQGWHFAKVILRNLAPALVPPTFTRGGILLFTIYHVKIFGLILLELPTGRKAGDHTMPHGQHRLVTWATPRRSVEDMVK
ncbi:unnamed protein product [Dovyalis caffra]|uniref:Uncharacterized protein n=1 Tax=Dovyalis caffra TaxID=77055 RepID=A0AAV1RDD2_9ROSI|nr:unnamed protein product [Dovyalis caffra]